MKKITTIIADDEKKARSGLENMVRSFQDLELVATCKDGVECIEMTDALKPDLLLLDIQMPGVDGLDVMKSITHQPFVIFITAYDQYAIQAFEVHALDYLLKPFSNARFEEAITNAQKIISSSQFQESLEAFDRFKMATPQHQDQPILNTRKDHRLVIRSEGKIILLNHKNIYHIDGYDYYVKIQANQPHLVKDSLKNLLSHLPGQFMRVHKSHIINLDHLQSLESIGHSELLAVLTNGSKVKVSRNYSQDILQRIKNS